LKLENANYNIDDLIEEFEEQYKDEDEEENKLN
jgi:hypothetical protein